MDQVSHERDLAELSGIVAELAAINRLRATGEPTLTQEYADDLLQRALAVAERRS
jgi:hypothetical protein